LLWGALVWWGVFNFDRYRKQENPLGELNQ